jgi:hypothetical protein
MISRAGYDLEGGEKTSQFFVNGFDTVTELVLEFRVWPKLGQTCGAT